MKKLVAMLLVVVMILGVTACGKGGKEENSGNGKDTSAYDWSQGADASGGDVTLRVATWRSSDEAYYNEIIKRFEEKYDWIDVTLEITPSSNSYYSNLQADLTSGTAPDVFDMHPNTKLLGYAEAGMLAPQTDFDYMSNYVDDAKLVTTVYEENYGYMNAYNYFGFLYDKAAFAKHGLSVPTTPEELVSAVNTLKKAGYGGISYAGRDWPTGLSEACLMIALGTEGYAALIEGIDNGTITDVSGVDGVPEAYDTLQYYIENDVLYTAWEGVTFEASMSLYAQKKAAIVFCGSYVFGEKDKYFADIDTGFFPVPNYANTGLTYTQGAQTSCINASSKNLGAAKLWIEFLATPEISEYYCSNAKMLSTIKDVAPAFDEAEMLLDSCKGYAARAIEERENEEYWNTAFNTMTESILAGEDWKGAARVFASKMEEFDLANQ